MDYGTFKKLITVEGILLFIQYMLGMGVNLFVEIPADAPLNFFAYSDGIEVLIHIANGVLILAIAVLILFYSMKLTKSVFSKLSIIGIVFVILAVATGIIFITGGLNDSFSAAMALSFISVYTVYFYEFYLIGKEETL